MKLYIKGDYYLNGETMYIREKIYEYYWHITRYSHTREVTFRVIR